MYAAFNRRDIAAVLEQMATDVESPNGWEGGLLDGSDQVRRYCERQWAELDPTVTPTRLTLEPQP